MYLIHLVIFMISLVLFDILHVFSRAFNELHYIDNVHVKFDLLYFEVKLYLILHCYLIAISSSLSLHLYC